MVHEILTSEIPFLDPGRDTNMTITDQFTTCDDTPEVDMELLYKYCRDLALFPTQPLNANGMGDMWQDFVKSLMAVDPRDRPSAADALNSQCFTENDLEMLRIQLGLLLSVELRSASIAIILESELAVFIAILHSFGGTTIHELHRKATDMGFLEVVWLVGRTEYETYCGGDLSSLQLPSWYGKIDMIKVMLDCGLVRDNPRAVSLGQKALRRAAANGHLDVVKLLIAQGAEINAKAGQRIAWTALVAAVRNRRVDVVKLLIAEGADLNATSGDYGSETALEAAAANGDVDTIRVLLSHGANVNAINGRKAALHIAAKKGRVDAIRVLLAHGADVNVNYRGWTALHEAAEIGHVGAIKILLAHGADFDEEDKGWPALQTAVVYGQVNAIRVLLAHGAEVGGEDSGGTVLHRRAGGGWDRPMYRLVYVNRVDRMADVQEDPKRWTPLQLAAKNRHSNAITVLLAHGLGMVSHTVATADMASG